MWTSICPGSSLCLSQMKLTAGVINVVRFLSQRRIMHLGPGTEFPQICPTYPWCCTLPHWILIIFMSLSSIEGIWVFLQWKRLKDSTLSLVLNKDVFRKYFCSVYLSSRPDWKSEGSSSRFHHKSPAFKSVACPRLSEKCKYKCQFPSLQQKSEIIALSGEDLLRLVVFQVLCHHITKKVQRGSKTIHLTASK